MGRPRKEPSELRSKITITPHPFILSWIRTRIGLGRRFQSVTHAFDEGVLRLAEEEIEAERTGEPLRPIDPDLLKAVQAHTSEAKRKGGSRTESTKRT